MRTQGQKRRKGRRLPELLRPFFWQYPFGRLRWEKDRDLIIGHVLAHGTWDAIRWLLRHAGDDELRAWIMQREGRGLSSKQLRYWELMLGLPRRRVNAWLREPARLLWEKRGRR